MHHFRGKRQKKRFQIAIPNPCQTLTSPDHLRVERRSKSAHFFPFPMSSKLPKNGSIEVIFGYLYFFMIFSPMFSGKTSELQRRIRRHELGRRKCLLIKYAHDQRYSQADCATHDLYV